MRRTESSIEEQDEGPDDGNGGPDRVGREHQPGGDHGEEEVGEHQ